MLNVLKQMPTAAIFLELMVVLTSHVVKILLSRDCVCRNSACGFTNHSEHPIYYNHNSAIVFCSKLSCGWEHTQLLNWNIDKKLELVTSLCISLNYVWLLQSL